MKVDVMFKTCDVLDYVTSTMNESEVEELKALTDKYIKYDEMVTLQFDTEESTVKVLEA